VASAAPTFPPDFIPTRHGARRDDARAALGLVRLAIRGEPEPSRALWRDIGLALMQGDPPADRLVAWMQANGLARQRERFEQALEHGIETVKDAPGPLRDFFALVDTRPPWVSERLLREALPIIHRGGIDYFYVGRDLALMGGYQASAFNKTLLITGALQKGPTRRVAETSTWWRDCTTDGGLERFGVGFKATVRVRFIHALVRSAVQRLPEWNTRDWGLPVNQTDMAATALAFPMIMLVAGRLLGVPVSSREVETAMHLGRYVGHLMGVEPRWLPWDEQEGLTLLYRLSLSITNADATSVQLGQALMDEPLSRHYAFLGGLRGPLERQRHLSLSRFFLGKQGLKNLGLPTSTLPWYPLLRVPVNLGRHLAARLVPGGRARLEAKGKAQIRAVLAQMSGAHEAKVGEAAQHLAR